MTAPRARRIPIIPTVLVVIAIAAMIGLGLWQVRRADEKHRLLAVYAANVAAPPTALTVRGGPVPSAMLFRRATATCVAVVGWRTTGGRSSDGRSGFRRLADCSTGIEGPGFVADMGLSDSPNVANPAWTGGPVAGVVTEEPVAGGLIAVIMRTRPVPRPMIVAATPLPGLIASAAPDPRDVPDNHIAYAVTWFIFAALAAIIYLLALRQRARLADAVRLP